MLLSLSLLTAMPMVASAHSLKSFSGSAGYHGKAHLDGFWGASAPSGGGTPSASVPELDPSAATAAFALLAGGAAVIAGRRRKSA
jgi:hypothetical protein